MSSGASDCSTVRCLVLDVDGVLTDGGVILDGGTGELKRFHSRDGVGIKLALSVGWRVLFLTARASAPARRRAEELGAEWAIGIKRKDVFLEDWLQKAKIGWEEVAYVGDDLQDLAVLRRVGTPVAVADACREVREAATRVTELAGGAGAVRETVEWLLEKQNLRQSAVEAFVGDGEGFAVGEPGTGDSPPPAGPGSS